MEILHMAQLETVTLQGPAGARQGGRPVSPEGLTDRRDLGVLKFRESLYAIKRYEADKVRNTQATRRCGRVNVRVRARSG
ncbi:unnamed protein product [Macrosiphum euphorbiae]|uniref:Uncharacterized protein n=1 Tax=Macrosiphum euphorbiae TaxID=13131 RepID=A0AAV0XPH3_9HEMI|nr:unnamed protein product [Macrosiphum euphorbiae]